MNKATCGVFEGTVLQCMYERVSGVEWSFVGCGLVLEGCGWGCYDRKGFLVES